MSTESVLNERELNLLLKSRNMTLNELASEYNLQPFEVKEMLDGVKTKLFDDSIRITAENEFLPRPTSYRLGKNVGETQLGTMKVGSKILEILSKGIYSAPWNSLKELINNSYDADAEEVHITYDSSKKTLLLSDTGKGMGYLDFDDHFTFIVKSEKRDEGENSKKWDRPLIGKIGIGFVAVSELCDQIKVTSTKEGSDIYFEAFIDFSKITSDESANKEFYEVSQFTLTNYEKKDISQHYTTIELFNLKLSFLDIMENRSSEKIQNISPENIEDFVDLVNDVKSVRASYGPYWEFILHLSNMIPILYCENGPINFESLSTDDPYHIDQLEQTKNIINKIQDNLKSYNFKVFFNGLELKKPLLFPHNEKAHRYGVDMLVVPIQSQPVSTEDEYSVKYSGYCYYQRTLISPEELHGLSLKLRNVSIGDPSPDFLGHPSAGDTTYFPQAYCEIYVEYGLEDAMNIDRSTFKTTHEGFRQFRKELHIFMRKYVFQKAKNMWKLRKDKKAKLIEVIRDDHRLNAVQKYYGRPFDISGIRDFRSPVISVDDEAQLISLNYTATNLANYKKDDKLLLQDIALALEAVLSDLDNKDILISNFWEILREITEYRR